MSLYTIELENMEFHAFHGCYDLEQIVGNRFLVNVTITAHTGLAVENDDVNDTVNYLRVFELVGREMVIKSHIIEHVAARINTALRETFPQIETVRTKVSKLAPPLGGKIEKVSVTLEG